MNIKQRTTSVTSAVAAAVAVLATAVLKLPPAHAFSPSRRALTPGRSEMPTNACSVTVPMCTPSIDACNSLYLGGSGRHRRIPSHFHCRSRTVLDMASEASPADMNDANQLSNGVSMPSAIDIPKPKSDMKKRFAAAMAFLTGWGQVATFLKYQTFSTMLTGNTMWMARALVESRLVDVVYYASVIFSYMIGLAAFRGSDRKLKNRYLSMACTPLVVSLFVGSDMLMDVLQNRWIPVSMLAAGFGIVNSVGQQIAGTLTFVITGHYTRLTQQIMDRCSRTAGNPKFLCEATYMGIGILASFFCGALTASAAFQSTLPGPSPLPGWVWRKSFSILGLSYGALFLWYDLSKR